MIRHLPALLLFSALPASGTALAGDTAPLPPTVCEQIGTYDIGRLEKIGTTELRDFETTKTDLVLPSPKNPVNLYRVKYRTLVPERGNRPVEASGLIAIPAETRGPCPVVSYQHGTVFSRTEVPSNPEESPETRLAITAFAARGFIVIAADYIGKGQSPEPDSYMVGESTAQACYDMLAASRPILSSLDVSSGDLFLSGWSQGAWATKVFLKKLETLGEPVKASAAASTPNDLYFLVNRWINHRSDQDASWIVGSVALFLNSYENYYGFPGLSSAAIRPDYLQTAIDFYNNKIGWSEASKVFPKTVAEFLKPGFAAESSLGQSRFYRQLADNQAYRWRSVTPSRCYYGGADEVIPPYIATLSPPYQDIVGGAASKAVFAGNKADHRGTFLFGLNDQIDWFASLSK